MTRREFTKSTKLAAWDRCGGRCECCGVKIISPEYDHIVPWAVSRDGGLSNCMVLDKKCHRLKTSEKDVPQISKSVRVFEKRVGVRKTRRPFQNRPDPWGKGRDA
jgi:5-methylcytosine-specific restriction enzyme A